MIRWLAQFFRSSPSAPKPPLTDDVLGQVAHSAESDDWQATVQLGDREVRFTLGGKERPDAGLLTHAREIVKGFAAFEEMIRSFLVEEASRKEVLGDEIRSLEIEDISLFWPDRPTDGMIFFKGPDELRLWRCDYVKCKPQSLGYDS